MPSLTYDLARLAGDSHELALHAATEAAVKQAEQEIIERQGMALREYIAGIEEELDEAEPENLERHEHFRQAFIWLAERMIHDLPVRSMERTYAPWGGDYVQAVITGEVILRGPAWTIRTETGDEYEFEGGADVQVRVIATPKDLD